MESGNWRVESGERRATLQLLFVIKNHSASKLIIKRNLALPLALSVCVCVFFLIVSLSWVQHSLYFWTLEFNLSLPQSAAHWHFNLASTLAFSLNANFYCQTASPGNPACCCRQPHYAIHNTVPYVCKSKLKCNKTQTSARRRVRAVKGSTLGEQAASLITGLCTRVARAVCWANIWNVSKQFGQLY